MAHAAWSLVMSEELLASIETLKSKAQSHISELKALPQMTALLKIHTAMNTIEGLCGIDPTSLSELFGLDEVKATSVRRLVSVGEFFGKGPLEAAKLFLKKKNSPASLDEIVENLTFGSCEVKNKQELRISLSRSTFEIARLNDDNFGLLDWYPEEKQKRSWSNKKKPASGPSGSDPPAFPEGANGPAGL
jgi:hypothetical protein